MRIADASLNNRRRLTSIAMESSIFVKFSQSAHISANIKLESAPESTWRRKSTQTPARKPNAARTNADGSGTTANSLLWFTTAHAS